MDIYDEVVPGLNGLYKKFYDVQKATFKPTLKHKKIDYLSSVDELEKNSIRAREIYNYISDKPEASPLLKDFAENLVSATQWMYLYFIAKAIKDSTQAEHDANVAFDELFTASRRLTKSAKKIS